MNKVGKDMAVMAGRAVTAGIALARTAASVGAVASAAVAVAPLLAKAVMHVGALGKAALQASPALLGMAATGAFVAVTLKRIAPAIGAALKPIATGFDAATEAAGRLASRGLEPLARGFVKANMPAVAASMNRIAVAANKVVGDVLRWANSAPGMAAIRNIVSASASAFERIGPAVTRFAVALGSMLGRIAGVSAAAGASGLLGVLDKLAEKMDRVTADTVRGGLDKLAGAFAWVRGAASTVGDVIGRVTAFWRQHTVEIGYARDALAVLAIAFGGPVAAVAGAVALIIRHWDQLKAVWQGVVAYFQSPASGGFLDNIRAAVELLWPKVVAAFETIKAAVLPVLTEIWAKITNELIPALGAFTAALAPVVAFLIDVLAPVVAAVFKMIWEIISSTLDVIIGLFKVFTGILTGDWSKAWEGIRQIVDGVFGAIVAIVRAQLDIVIAIAAGAWRVFTDLTSWAVGEVMGIIGWFGDLPGLLWGWFNGAKDAAIERAVALVDWVRGLPGLITGALGNLGGLLKDAGASVIQGFIDGITGGFQRVQRELSKLTGMLPDWKGPPIRDRSLLTANGRMIMQSLTRGFEQGRPGIERYLGNLTNHLGDVMTSTSLAIPGLPSTPTPAAAGGGQVRVVIDHRGATDELFKIFQDRIRVNYGGSADRAFSGRRS